jgi:hypothetical protein
MTAFFTDAFSFESATRDDVHQLLSDVINGGSLSYLHLDVNKGDTPEATIAVLLSNASAVARRVFAEALDDLLQTCADEYLHGKQDAVLSRVLDLLEIALAEGDIPLDAEITIGILSEVSKHADEKVAVHSARVLSYFRSNAAVETINALRRVYPRNNTIAAYLIEARSNLDPLTAFDIDFGEIDQKGSERSPEFVMAVQSTIQNMFDKNGPLARTKLSVSSAGWPVAFLKLVHETLEDVPLDANVWARAAARELASSSLMTTLRAGGMLTGIAQRVLEHKAVACLGGFAMSVVETGRFKPYQAPWMKEFAEQVCSILASLYPHRSTPSVDFQRWPSGERWLDVFERLLLRAEKGKSRKEKGPRHTIDICFEVVYINNRRLNTFSIIELARLHTFSVVYHQDNARIRRYFRSNKANADLSIEKALRSWKRMRDPVLHILAPVANVAGDLMADYVTGGRWVADNYHLIDDLEQLRRWLDQPDKFVVICDNVTAMDLVPQAKSLGHVLVQSRLLYPEPISVGLAFDVSDPLWGAILNEALERVVASTKADVKDTLRQFTIELEAIDANPSGILAEAVSAIKRTSRRTVVKQQ